MPPLDFPNPPLTVNQTFTASNGVAYLWDGTKWTVQVGSGGGGGTFNNPVTIVGVGSTDAAVASPVLTLDQSASGNRTVQIQYNGQGRSWIEGTTPSGWWYLRDHTAGVNRLSITDTGFFAVNAPGSNVGGMEIVFGGSTNSEVVLPHLMLKQNQGAGDGPNAVQIHMHGGNRSWIEGVTTEGWWYLHDVTAGIDRVSVTDAGFFAVNSSFSPSMEIINNTGHDCHLDFISGLRGAPGTFAWTIGVQGTGSAGAGGFWIYDYNSNADRLRIDPSGACYNTTGTWSALSDPRVKQNIEPYSQGLAAIRQLNPIAFQYNGLASTQAGFQSYGLDADAVARVMPELIGKLTLKMDEGDEAGTDLGTVDSGRLVFALINAVKELAAKVDELERDRK